MNRFGLLPVALALLGLSTTAFADSPAQGEEEPSTVNETRVLFDFLDEEQLSDWTTVNDTVMGGVSNSGISLPEKGTAEWKGRVSLENNGGFAAARTRPMDHGLSGEDGVIVRVKGDGKTYKMSFAMTRGFDSVGYQMDFATVRDEWIEVSVPFSECRPRWHGMSVPFAPQLKAAKIQRVGFLIADKQEGEFRLLISSIRGYVDAEESAAEPSA
jgi:hypothetical protein